jgi:hypothetical protein
LKGFLFSNHEKASVISYVAFGSIAVCVHGVSVSAVVYAWHKWNGTNYFY